MCNPENRVNKKFNKLTMAKLELLRELTNDTINNGRTQWNNRSILSWIDKQKEEINKIENGRN